MEYSDAVEKWAREHGGHARLQWLEHPMNCWCVKLSYKVGDPRQGSSSDGEPVLLHEWWTAEQWRARKPHMARRHYRSNQIMPGYYAFDLDELGVEGIVQRLDKGNILSGRGQFTSAEQAGRQQVDEHRENMDRLRAEKRAVAGDKAKDRRRQILKIPFLPVGIDLSRATTKGTTKESA